MVAHWEPVELFAEHGIDTTRDLRRIDPCIGSGGCSFGFSHRGSKVSSQRHGEESHAKPQRRQEHTSEKTEVISVLLSFLRVFAALREILLSSDSQLLHERVVELLPALILRAAFLGDKRRVFFQSGLVFL